jgi:hypothetical protein
MAAPSFVSVTSTAFDGTTPKTTASISVQTGDILVAKAGNGDQGDGDLTVAGGSLTWTQQQTVSVASNTEIWVWTATASSTTSITVTFARPAGTGSFGGSVEVWRASDGVGASSSTNNTGGPSLGITTLQANSAVSVFNQDWNAVDGAVRTWRTINSITPTAGNGFETLYNRIVGGFTTYSAYYGDVGATGAKTAGLSAPVGQKYSIAAIEIKGTAGASTVTKGRLSLLGVGV